MRYLFILLIGGFLISCNNNSDCTNGIQDGNETGVDCGGNCPPCQQSPPPNSSGMDGVWQLIRWDEVYYDQNGDSTDGTTINYPIQTDPSSGGYFYEFSNGIISQYPLNNNYGTYNSSTGIIEIPSQVSPQYLESLTSTNMVLTGYITITNPNDKAIKTYYLRY